VLAHQESRSGDEQSATARLREAQVHERTAELLQQTAALYRTHANRAARSKAAGVPEGLASTLRRTVDALEHTARLAEQHAVRLEGLGQSDAAADEREAAQRAHGAAQRARSQAEGLAVDREQ